MRDVAHWLADLILRLLDYALFLGLLLLIFVGLPELWRRLPARPALRFDHVATVLLLTLAAVTYYMLLFRR